MFLQPLEKEFESKDDKTCRQHISGLEKDKMGKEQKSVWLHFVLMNMTICSSLKQDRVLDLYSLSLQEHGNEMAIIP